CARGMRALAGLVPMGEALLDIAGEAMEQMRMQQVEDRLAALQELAQAEPAEVQEAAREIAAEAPPEVHKALTLYLELVPAAGPPRRHRGAARPGAARAGRPGAVPAAAPAALPPRRPGARAGRLGAGRAARQRRLRRGLEGPASFL